MFIINMYFFLKLGIKRIMLRGKVGISVVGNENNVGL